MSENQEIHRNLEKRSQVIFESYRYPKNRYGFKCMAGKEGFRGLPDDVKSFNVSRGMHFDFMIVRIFELMLELWLEIQRDQEEKKKRTRYQ
ncbi:unnamed protein product [Caenorhabditis angaria]|uniref:Uncharacterized protein n=1 Tax=Caenorhabditis angaria TaxID=860376 RepID=A0A9P1I8V5_9PELO|nr:unnamed protein product [Caenorhabditis angaria]